MEKNCRFLRTLALAVFALSLMSCEALLEQKTETKISEFKISACTPGLKTDKLQIGIPYAPVTFNPALAVDSVSQLVSAQLTATLFRFNPVTLQFEPNLATRFERQEDGQTFTVHLRKNLTFSDGKTPFTADDVVATIRYILNNRVSSSLASYLTYYKGKLEATKLDDSTVQIKAAGPLYAIAPALARIPVLCERQLKEVENAPENFLSVQTTKPDSFLGMGPFVPKSVDAEKIVLERNKYYWVQDIVGARLPYANEVHILITKGTADLAGKLEEQVLDMVDNMDPAKWALMKATGEYVLYPPSEADAALSSRQYMLWFNQSPKQDSGDTEERGIHYAWLKEKNFRLAFATAINRTTVAGPLKGKLEPDFGFVPPWYDGWGSPVAPTEGNLAEAKRILTEQVKCKLSGAEDKVKLVDKSDNPIRLQILVIQGDSACSTLAAEVTKTFKALGAEVTVAEVSITDFFQKYKAADYDMALLPVDSVQTPDFLREVFSSLAYGRLYAPEPNAQPEEDQRVLNLALERMAATGVFEDRKAACRSAQECITKGVYMIPLVRPRPYFGAQKALGNLQPGPGVTTLTWNLEEVYKATK